MELFKPLSGLIIFLCFWLDVGVKVYCSAGFNGFDGATEWFLFDSSVLDEYKKIGA